MTASVVRRRELHHDTIPAVAEQRIVTGWPVAVGPNTWHRDLLNVAVERWVDVPADHAEDTVILDGQECACFLVRLGERIPDDATYIATIERGTFEYHVYARRLVPGFCGASAPKTTEPTA